MFNIAQADSYSITRVKYHSLLVTMTTTRTPGRDVHQFFCGLLATMIKPDFRHNLFLLIFLAFLILKDCFEASR